MAVDRRKDFVAGRRFAYRESARSWGTPVRPVEFVKAGPLHSKRVRIRLLDGEYKGIEEWVPAVRLIVPWDEAEAYLQDERRNLEPLEANEGTLDRITWDAVMTVLDSLMHTIPAWEDGEQQISIDRQDEGEGLLYIRNFEAFVPELGLGPGTLLAEPHAYINRFGSYYAPLQTALWVAQHCCRHFKRLVLREVQAQEDALQTAATRGYYVPPGWSEGTRRMRVEEVVAAWHREEPFFTLVREWCGEPPAEPLDLARGANAEIERLGAIIEETAEWLHKKKYYRKVKDLRRELGERPRKPRPLTLEQMTQRAQEYLEEPRAPW